MINIEEFEKQLTDFEKQLQNYHMPRYRELPDIELYMDQVIVYVNKYLNIFSKKEENVITPSMINNYVKHGILPPPVGKKYGRTHLAYICAVFFLKQVLKMDEIKAIIQNQIEKSNEFKAYTYFCMALEQAFKNCCLLNKKEAVNHESPLDKENYALKSSTIAIANLIYAQKVIELQTPPPPPKEKKESKKD